MMKAKVITLGCKVNQYESEAMLSSLLQHGFAAAEDKDCLLYTSPSPRDYAASRMPSSA